MIYSFTKSDTFFQNDLCVFWNNTGSINSTWDQQGCVNYKQSESMTYCKCNHLTNFAVLYYPYDDQPPESRGLTILTYLCAFLSIICCVITIVAHLLQHRQRTNQHKQILMSLCVALIGRDVFFLTVLLGSDLRSTDSQQACSLPNRAEYDTTGWSNQQNIDVYGYGTISYPNRNYTQHYAERTMPPGGVVLAALAHYFMVAVLAWTACEGIHVYFNVVNVLSRPRHRYLTKLSMFAWGTPLVITSIALLVEQYSPKHDGFKMFLSTQYTDQREATGINIYYYVWLEYELFIGTIVVPFAIVFFFNTIMFGMVMVALMNTQNPIVKTYKRISRHLSRQNSRHTVTVNKEHDLQKTQKIKDTRRTVQGAIALLVILGVSYIFMFFMLNGQVTKQIVAYFFIIFNALQGVWIFVFHALLKDDVLPNLICPGYVRKRKLEKKMSNSTEQTNSREHSDELYPSGMPYMAKAHKANRITHSPTVPTSSSDSSSSMSIDGHHGKLQLTKSLPAMRHSMPERQTRALQRQVQFKKKH